MIAKAVILLKWDLWNARVATRVNDRFPMIINWFPGKRIMDLKLGIVKLPAQAAIIRLHVMTVIRE
jgi:hypothetical protein